MLLERCAKPPPFQTPPQVAYRGPGALRAAIRGDMDKGDFEAATMLANEMEWRFATPRKPTSSATRSKPPAAANDRPGAKHPTMSKCCRPLEWLDATREAERLQRQFPSHPEVRKLSERIQSAKDSHAANC